MPSLSTGWNAIEARLSGGRLIGYFSDYEGSMDPFHQPAVQQFRADRNGYKTVEIFRKIHRAAAVFLRHLVMSLVHNDGMGVAAANAQHAGKLLVIALRVDQAKLISLDNQLFKKGGQPA